MHVTLCSPTVRSKVETETLFGTWRCPLCKYGQDGAAVGQRVGSTMLLLTCTLCLQETPRKYWKVIEGTV